MTDNWNWSQFLGSAEGLKWNRKELSTVDVVLDSTPGRRVAVQAGGNLGIFPKYLSSRFDFVYSFEPEPELFRMATRNAPERNIVWTQAALGCERKLVHVSRLRRQQDGGNAHEGIAHVSGPGFVPTLRIDDLALPICDLIYLDLEGYELYALRGAVETIARCRPVVVCEINKSLAFMDYTERDIREYIDAVLHYDWSMRVRSDEIFLPRKR